MEGEDRPRCAGKQGTNKSNASRGHASAPVRPSVMASWSLCRNSWGCKAGRGELLYVYALPGGLAMTKEYILTLVRAEIVVPIQGHELISLSQRKTTMQNETLIRYTLRAVNVATSYYSLQRPRG